MTWQFGPFLVDRSAYRVLRDGVQLVAPPKLLDLLMHLLEHAGDLVTKEALLDSVWPDANVTDNALAQAVSELRQLLGDEPAEARYIKTVARRGYRFVAPVTVVSAPIGAGAGPSVAAAAAAQSAASAWPAGLASASAVPAGPAEPNRIIAVLDFQNVSGDPDIAWLSAGIAETVTGDLRALDGFRVLDRRRVVEAVVTVGGSMQAVARETGANLIVVGSFQRSRSRIRITARLVDAVRGEAVADAKVDGPVEAIFELQDQIVIDFAREIGAAVESATGSRIGARETTSIEAYRAFTSGWLRLETLDVDELPAAVDDFRHAITIDHRYALAHTGLASAQFAVYESTRSDNEPARQLLDDAIEHARHAVALDDGLAEGHATLGFLLVSHGQAEEAVSEARRAVALEPGNWRHHFRLGHASWGSARLRAADATLALHPGFAFAHFQAAMVHVARGNLIEAASVLRRGAALQDRQHTKRERFPALGLHWLLGLVHLAQDEIDAAIGAFDRELAVVELNRLYGREYAMHAHLGRGQALLAAGKPSEATHEFGIALGLYPAHAQTLLAAAAACAAAGDEAGRQRHLAAADTALDVLVSMRPTEAAIVRALRLVVEKKDVEHAAAIVANLLKGAPASFAGWTLPIEPLLASARQHGAFAGVLSALAERAT